MANHKNCTWTVNGTGQKQADESKKAEGEPVQDTWRRQCGCIRTSEKLKQILNSFPAPPPPSPTIPAALSLFESCCPPNQNVCISAYRMHGDLSSFNRPPDHLKKQTIYNKSWLVVTELVQLVQLSVTATALVLYYLIYCYMQLIYLTLRSALYFHNADGPMKITIGIITVTSLIIGINILMRIEKIMGYIGY